jgi:hypothetical protein
VIRGVFRGKCLPPGSSTAVSNKFLYRRWTLPVIIALLVFAVGVPSFAQMPELKRPNEEPVEKPPAPKKVKKVKGPRAVALLQTTSKGKTTLIPIAIQVEGKFYDASEYKADPVPMALESGTVYEVERSGGSEGLFTINRALHFKSPNSLHPWVGDGSFVANGTEAASRANKAENVPRGINNSDDAPPRLTRATTPSDSSSGSAASPASSDKNAPPSGSSDKSAASSTPSSSTAPSAAPATGSPSDSSPKTSAGSNQDSKQSPTAPASSSTQSGQGQAAPAKPGDQSQENYYRPTLRRGKPTTQAPPEEEEEDQPTPSKVASKGSPPGSKDNTAAANANPPQLVPAISDEGGPDPRSYKFFWKTGEEEDRRDQMQALAATEVKAYVAALEKNRISAQPAATKKPTPHKAAAKPVQPEFENIHFQGFDVWLNNQPLMVFTAEAHMPAAAGSDIPPETYNVTLVARTDIYGDLRKIYSGVTDRFHLDVTPKLELIDVVDADGDGRGELLFNETTDAGSGYVIYRATADKLWKLFDSLGGGA